MAAPAIFISYRREDSAGQAGRIFDRLVERFGKDHVFRDLDDIIAGEDFVDTIRAQIKQSDVLLALIGPRWLTATDEEGRWRLAKENDWVRVEIVSALDRNLRVIPVLLQGTPIPKASELPGELARLVRRHAFEIRENNFDLDVSLLIEKLRPSWRNKMAHFFSRWSVIIVLILILLGALGFWIYPQFAYTQEKARIMIVQMGMQFDADTFVEQAKSNDLQAIELFLRAGMDPNAENNKNVSALTMAAANGHLDLVKTLIAHSADINKALPWAAGHGQKQVLDYMMTFSPSQAAINHALYSAAGGQHIDIVQLLLDKGVDINFVDQRAGISVLINAMDNFNPDIELIRLLLSKGADVNLKGNHRLLSALFVAAGKFNVVLVDLILAQGADVNIKDQYDATPLHEAISANNTFDEESELERLNIVRSLLVNGADLGARVKWLSGWEATPLMWSLRENNPRVALLLIEHGADVNDQAGNESSSKASRTALMLAAEQGMMDVVKVLLDKGADVNARNQQGTSPLLIAASTYNSNEMVRILLLNGADAGATDEDGRTVLMKVARSKGSISDETMQELMKGGAKINATDKNGWTALMHSADAYYQRVDITRQLLNHGADKSLLNDEGQSALTIARRMGYKKIATLLSSH